MDPEQWLESAELRLQLEEQALLGRVFAAVQLFPTLDDRMIDAALGVAREE